MGKNDDYSPYIFVKQDDGSRRSMLMKANISSVEYEKSGWNSGMAVGFVVSVVTGAGVGPAVVGGHLLALVVSLVGVVFGLLIFKNSEADRELSAVITVSGGNQVVLSDCDPKKLERSIKCFWNNQ
jgi:hypothetical protein